MPKPVRRNVWLAAFATLNLLAWVIVAAAIVTVASDRVNLGMESAIRRWQATAMAGGQRSTPPAVAHLPAGLGPLPAAGLETPVASSGMSGMAPESEATALASIASSATGSGTAPFPEPTAQTGISGSEAGQSEPASAAAVSGTLLALTDPEFGLLAALESELQASTTGRPVRVRYGEAAFNRELTALLGGEPGLPFREVMIDFRQDAIAATGKMPVLGIRLRVGVVGKITVQDCLPRLAIDSVSVAGISAPAPIRQRVEGEIQRALSGYPVTSAFCLELIVLEDDQATLFGYRR